MKFEITLKGELFQDKDDSNIFFVNSPLTGKLMCMRPHPIHGYILIADNVNELLAIFEIIIKAMEN